MPQPSTAAWCIGTAIIVILVGLVYNYLLTPWNIALLEKLTIYQPVKKFPTFYGTRWFITAFTSARHLSPS